MIVDTIKNWLNVPPPEPPPDRHALVVQLEAATAPPDLTQQHAEYEAAKARREELERELAQAKRAEADAQAATWGRSTQREHEVATLRRQLRDSAPAWLEVLRDDVRALVDDVRGRVESLVVDGHERTDGRRGMLTATNVAEVDAVVALARQIDAKLEALLYAADPSPEAFAPFAEIRLPRVTRWVKGARPDEPAYFVPRPVTVPKTLADAYAAVGGVASPRPVVTPAEARQAAWDAEDGLERRWPSNPREWR